MLVGVAVIAVLGYFILLHRSCREAGGLVESPDHAKTRWEKEEKFKEATKVWMCNMVAVIARVRHMFVVWGWWSGEEGVKRQGSASTVDTFDCHLRCGRRPL